jgi:hypothetical protein
MGQAKNRGSLEERVKNAKKFRKEAILSELKKIVEGIINTYQINFHIARTI